MCKFLRMRILEMEGKKNRKTLSAIARLPPGAAIFDYGVQWKISAGRMLKSWKLSLTELKLDSR
jgi:hypothetical protein